MRHNTFRSYAAIAAMGLVLANTASRAEVVDAEANGFTVRHQVTISAERTVVYQAAVGEIGNWWSSDHTISGDAANLYIDAGIPGCFCERLGDGAGLIHLAVTFVIPEVLVRFSGGLGPLGLMGVAGAMTWEFEDADGGTVVTLQYAVGGYMPDGVADIAPAVDGVLVDQMTRLKSLVETGSAGQG